MLLLLGLTALATYWIGAFVGVSAAYAPRDSWPVAVNIFVGGVSVALILTLAFIGVKASL